MFYSQLSIKVFSDSSVGYETLNNFLIDEILYLIIIYQADMYRAYFHVCSKETL